MVLIVDKEGRSTITPSNVTAGTTAASIVVFSPFNKIDTCALYFGLPNGIRTAPRVLYPSEKQDFEQGTAYEFRFTSDIVANRGMVEVVAEFTSAEGAVFRSYPASFNVIGTYGITVPEYAETDPWAEVMTALSAIAGTVGTFGSVVQTVGESERDVMSQKAVTNLFKDLTYVAPTITTLSLTPSAGSYKLPATYKLSQISHKESNAENIEGYLTLKVGSTIIKRDIEPSAEMRSVTIEGDSNHTLSTVGTSYTLSGVDKRGNPFSKTVSVVGYNTAYIGVSENYYATAEMVKALNDLNSATLNGNRTIQFDGNAKYIWFCSTASKITATSSGFSVPLILSNNVTINGATYYCYRTTEKVLAGTHTFVIS